MPARRAKALKLRPAAQEDLQTIWLATAGLWSVEQAEKDVRRIHDALQQIVRNPDIGAIRPELGGSIRVKSARAHIVLYRIGEDHIDVIRIRETGEDWIRTPQSDDDP